MERIADFRSDTVTLPTQAMRDAMYGARVGDDMLGCDPTVKELERLAARITGKEAALFLISGSMANQTAVAALTRRGDEILVGQNSHIYNLEVGGLASTSQVQARPLPGVEGETDLKTLEESIKSEDLQVAGTSLLCLENTYDLTLGIPLSPEYVKVAAETAHRKGALVYMDGARLFNAAVYFGVEPSKLTEHVDAAMFCLCKGLAAPLGAMLVGTEAFVTEARRVRQRLGGGMRQAGFMAATGIVALETMIPRLAEDHAKAQKIVDSLRAVHADLVVPSSGRTNIVKLDFASVGKDARDIAQSLKKEALLVKPLSDKYCRMITHLDVSMEDVDHLVRAIKNRL